MRPQKVEDTELLSSLMEVIRFKGYEGSSLNELASASGLQKASLYHRFPKGKQQIALAVLSFVKEWVHKNIYLVLKDKKIASSERVNTVLENIVALYNNGEKSCILSALSVQSSVELFNAEIKIIMEEWISGFYALGIDCGLEKNNAKSLATTVLISIEGSLIVSKGLGTNQPFVDALTYIRKQYLKQ
jgi:AcrR family transcriptional regulator